MIDQVDGGSGYKWLLHADQRIVIKLFNLLLRSETKINEVNCSVWQDAFVRQEYLESTHISL